MAETIMAKDFISDEEMKKLESPGIPDFISDEEMAANEPNMVQTALGYAIKPIQWIGEKVEKYSSGPTRAAISAGLEGNNPASAAWQQFGSDQPAPSGQKIATQVGIPNQNIPIGQYGGSAPGVMSMINLGENLPGSNIPKGQRYLNPSEEAGVYIEAAADPLNLIAFGSNKAGKVSKAVSNIAESMAPTAVENAAEIAASAKRLGIPTTPAMMTTNNVVRGLEESLREAPTLPGWTVRRQANKIFKSLKDISEQTLGNSPVYDKKDAGNFIKSKIVSDIAEKTADVGARYDEIEDIFKTIPVENLQKDTNIKQLFRNSQVRLFPSTGRSKKILDSVISELPNIKTLEDLKQYRSGLAKNFYLPDMKPEERQFIDNVYSALTNIRNGAISGAKNIDKSVKDPLLQELYSLDDYYKTFMKETGSVDELVGGYKSRSPRQLADKIDNMDPNTLYDKMFNLSKPEKIEKFKNLFPDAFEHAKSHKLQEILHQVKGRDGRVSPLRFIKRVDRMSDSEKSLLFGDKYKQILKDLDTYVRAYPELKQGSRTAHFQGGITRNLTDLAKLAAYKAMPSASTKLKSASSIKPKKISAMLSASKMTKESETKKLFGGKK
jgi:hypothetical protein